MVSHCKGCVFHHNAKHPTDSNLAKKYNDWCCRFGKTAAKALGQCKLTNSKKA